MKLHTLFILALFSLASAATSAATQDLDQLLTSIKADIAAKRLSRPAGNNAIAHIQQFRKQAPFDYRVLPFAYEVGEQYVALANKEAKAGKIAKSQGYLDIVWQFAPLTAGLENAQANTDKIAKNKGKKIVKTKKVNKAAEQKRQKALAVAAAKEKTRLDAQRKEKAALKKKQAALAKQAAAEKKKQQQLAERQRRANQNKATSAKNQKAQRAAKVAAKVKKVQAPVKKPVKVEIVQENREALANYTLAGEKVSARNRAIKKDLAPICQAILDNGASVVLHALSKSDYRWLTVRLTLCTRKLDSGFRLRHSYQQIAEGKDPFVSLHPARTSSLLRSTR